MSSLVERLLAVPSWAVLSLVGLLVFAEDALFVGFVLPGETAALLGGVAARLGNVALTAMLVTVIAAAILGDSIGYEVGRRVGPRILQLRILDKRRDRLENAQGMLAQRGGPAVFLGRWVAFFRAVMPALAGSARMRYPTFLSFNAAGGITWGVSIVLLGYLAGEAYTRVEKVLGPATAVGALVVVVVAVVWRIRRHRAESRQT